MADLSILIPARNEEFLGLTIDDILKHMEGNTEVIVVLDGAWPTVPMAQHPKVHYIFHAESIGQRAATNEAARLSTAEFIMKVDAHCAFDQGFDRKLMERCEDDWTVIPRMWNLHVFDWVCQGCGLHHYQGPQPKKCAHYDKDGKTVVRGCEKEGPFQREIVWRPRRGTRNDFMRFDSNLRFGYWKSFQERPESAGDIADTMCCLGAAWFLRRKRYWELGGLDEAHGSWGQMGVEMACKSWLSGGRMVVNKTTWFAHLFRTQAGFGFPYPISGRAQDLARNYSRLLWPTDSWPGAKRPFQWILDHFGPVPGWESAPQPQSADGPVMSEAPTEESAPAIIAKAGSKGIVYYTDNRLDPLVAKAVQAKLILAGCHITSVSLRPMDFGDQNIVINLERGHLTMFRQILAGLEACPADIVFLCEHDVLYHLCHFAFVPERGDVYYYNEHTYKVDLESGQALFYYCKQTSGLCARRDLLIQHYQARVARVEREGKFDRSIGFEPGTHVLPRGVDSYGAERWMSEHPNIDIRHGQNLTASRWTQEEFRNKRSCLGWTMAEEVPGWGRTKGCFREMLCKIVG